MAVSQLAYIGIGVSDTAAWASFARDILGMEVGEHSHDGTVYPRMDEYHRRIAFDLATQSNIPLATDLGKHTQAYK
jgi:hypothetical protein